MRSIKKKEVEPTCDRRSIRRVQEEPGGGGAAHEPANRRAGNGWIQNTD